MQKINILIYKSKNLNFMGAPCTKILLDELVEKSITRAAFSDEFYDRNFNDIQTNFILYGKLTAAGLALTMANPLFPLTTIFVTGAMLFHSGKYLVEGNKDMFIYNLNPAHYLLSLVIGPFGYLASSYTRAGTKDNMRFVTYYATVNLVENLKEKKGRYREAASWFTNKITGMSLDSFDRIELARSIYRTDGKTPPFFARMIESLYTPLERTAMAGSFIRKKSNNLLTKLYSVKL
jgi:hypothetical protein